MTYASWQGKYESEIFDEQLEVCGALVGEFLFRSNFSMMMWKQ